MENILRINKEDIIKNVPNTNLVENRIEALKSLAVLLLREVESLQNFSQIKGAQKSTENLILSDEVKRFETELICDALICAKGQQRRAAHILGIKITTLNAKIKRYGIDLFNR